MLGNIHIAPNDLRDAARTMGTACNTMEGILNRTNRIIEDVVQDGWRDQAGAMLLERFRQLRTKYFHRYPEAMEAYADFLNRTADNYEIEEAARKRDIGGLSNMGQ